MTAAQLLAITLLAGTGLAGASPDVRAQTRDLTVIEQPAQPASPEGAPFLVSLVPVGGAVLRIGQPVRFKFVSTQGGFGSVYVADASGKVQLWAENVRMRAGQPLELPGRGLSIVASPPAGEETIVLLVTRERFAGFFGGGTVAKPADVQVSREGLDAMLRDKLGRLPRHRWATTQTSLRVTD